MKAQSGLHFRVVEVAVHFLFPCDALVLMPFSDRLRVGTDRNPPKLI
jgi:hypothetical protein